MTPTAVGGQINKMKQGKLGFPSAFKAGETPSETSKGDDASAKKKGSKGTGGKKPRHQGTPPRGSLDKEEDRAEIMDTEIGSEDTRSEEGVSPVQRVALNSQFQAVASASEFKILQGLQISCLGNFQTSEEGLNPRLGPARDLYVGKNFLKRLIISHGRHYADQVNKDRCSCNKLQANLVMINCILS